MVEQGIELDITSLKKIRFHYIILGIFVILAIYLRAYHLDFPSIGYHNMKENEYLGETMVMDDGGSLIHRQTYNFYGLEDGPGYFEEYAQPPLLPYLTLPFWKLFGEQLWIPRLIVMLFTLAAIICIYFVMKELTKNEYASLLSSFLLAIMPLGTYFGRNVQPDAPAMFCILLATYFYIKWTKNLDKKQLFYGMLAFSFAGLLKTTFLIGVVPLLFLFPFSEMLTMFKKDRKAFYQQCLYAFYGLLPFIIIQGIFQYTIVDPSKVDTGSLHEIGNIFKSSYWAQTWPALASYISDNYTWWFFWFAIGGLAFSIIKIKSTFSRFIVGSVAGLAAYIAVLSGKIGGHSYYQMPFLPLICILSAYFLVMLGGISKQILKVKYSEYAPLILILFTISAVQAADNRVWDTIFYGQDVVGQYIEQHTNPNDRIFNFGHSQTQAVCTYAKRRCGDANMNATQMQEDEKKFNIRYLNSDAMHFSMMQQNAELYNYVQNNYKIKLVALMPYNGQLTPIDILLEKGGKLNFSQLENKQPVLAKTYSTKQGDVPLYVIENP